MSDPIEYRQFIEYRLDELKASDKQILAEVRETNTELRDMREQIVKLRIRATAWGGVGGVTACTIAFTIFRALLS